MTLSLSDVACQTVHNINISDDLHSIRQRRQAQPLTQENISEIVDLHNERRAREGADNMETMIWNTSLVTLAATWAAGCHWGHPAADNEDYRTIGQNLYMGNQPSMESAITLWYDEKVDYTFDTMQCVPGKMCGHYKQVVWATTRAVGCAVHTCADITNKPAGQIVPADLLVCNYWPLGNERGEQPYTKGQACTKCGSGSGWCKNTLCNPQCSSNVEGCSCAAVCYNCGKPDENTCRCNCADGWHGVDCKLRCEDTNEHCNLLWDDYYCGAWDVDAGCPAMCGLCTKADPRPRPNQCPPATVGQPPANKTNTTGDGNDDGNGDGNGDGDGDPNNPDDSAQTTFINSQQSMMILLMVIITFIINSYDTM